MFKKIKLTSGEYRLINTRHVVTVGPSGRGNDRDETTLLIAVGTVRIEYSVIGSMSQVQKHLNDTANLGILREMEIG